MSDNDYDQLQHPSSGYSGSTGTGTLYAGKGGGTKSPYPGGGGPSSGKQAQKTQPKLPTLDDLIKVASNQIPPLYKPAVKARWEVVTGREVGRRVPAKAISAKEAVALLDTLSKSADEDIWDAWQVAFWQEPDFVIERLRRHARSLGASSDEVDAIDFQNRDRRGRRLTIPEEHKKTLLFGRGLGQANDKDSFEAGKTAAFYIPRDNQIFFIREAWSNPTLSAVAHTLSHELGHAYMFRHLTRPSLDFTFRRLLLILEIVEMNFLKIDDLKEGLAEVLGFEVYETWWSKHLKDPNVGAKEPMGYQHRANVTIMAEALLGSLGGMGVSGKAAGQAYFNGALTWEWPDPQDHLTLGAKRERWSWPKEWR